MQGRHHRIRIKKEGVKRYYREWQKTPRLQGLSPPTSKSNIDKSTKAGKKTHKTIYISWKNYVNDRYALVKADEGGVSRKMSFGNDTNRAEIFGITYIRVLE